ncbi:MAG: T9SS type A sorting domain-containing protein [Rhodothermia bacterium]|nr:T9SS type A sorting domain-containing protein [Rhodothermia bacterium]
MQLRARIGSTYFAVAMLVCLLCATVRDTAAQEWRIVAELPSSRTGMAVAALGEHIFLVGGRTRTDRASTTVLRYDPATTRWSDDVGQLHQPRVNPGVVTFAGRIFVIGGRNHEGEVLRSVEVYDPRQNTWLEFPELRREREGATAVVLREQIFVVGGSDQNERALETVETFNVLEERWDEIGEWKLDSPRVSPGVAAVGATIYIFGGFNVFGPVPAVQSYDTDLATSKTTDMPIEAGGLAAVPFGKHVYVIGGRSREGVLNAVRLFRTTDRSWSEVESMRVPRFNFGAVRLKNTIYVFGGIGSEGNPLRSVEAFGPLGVSSERPTLPADFGLSPAYPNPFQAETSLKASISASNQAAARLEIVDVLGRVVRQLDFEQAGQGEYGIRWDGRGEDGTTVAAGMYVARLRQGNYVDVTRLVLVR